MGGDRITTGSLLNQRVYSKKTSTTSGTKQGGGVQTNALLQTRITLANRSTGPTGRTSYTALSNQINGRKEVIYVGGQSCCGQAKMSTADKIALALEITKAGFELGQGIASLFGAKKADAPGATTRTTGTDSPGGTPSTKVGGDTSPQVTQDLATTLSSISSDDVISAMEDAETSADLQAAITDAENYFNGQLSDSHTEAKANAGEAQQLLDNYKSKDTLKKAKKDVEDAKQDVANSEQGVKSFEAKVAKEQRNIQEAQDALGEADTNYKKATEDTAFGEKSLAQAQKDVQTANQGVKTAETNVSTAQGKVDQLNMQLLTATPEQKASIQSQLTQAKTELSNAQQKLIEAKTRLQSANIAEDSAEKQLKTYQAAEERALNNVDNKKKGVTEAKEKLAESQEDLEKAQTQLEAKQKELEANKKALQDKEAVLEQTEQQIADAEAAIDRYDKLEKEYNSLKSEIADQKERLTKMAKKEQKKMDKLDEKIARQEEKSDRAEEKMNLDGQAQEGHDVSASERRAGRRMNRAELKEQELRAKRAAIAGSHISFDAAGVSGEDDEAKAKEGTPSSDTNLAQNINDKKKSQTDYMFHRSNLFT